MAHCPCPYSALYRLILLPCYIKPAGIDPDYLRFDNRIPKEGSQDPNSQTGMELSIALCCFPAKGNLAMTQTEYFVLVTKEGSQDWYGACLASRDLRQMVAAADGEREHAARLEVKPPLRRHTP